MIDALKNDALTAVYQDLEHNIHATEAVAVMKDIASHAEIAQRKKCTSLHSFYHEMLDAIVYLKQYILEQQYRDDIAIELYKDLMKLVLSARYMVDNETND